MEGEGVEKGKDQEKDVVETKVIENVQVLPPEHDNANEEEISSKKRIMPLFLLCFLFGCFGVHRFYVGKIGTGILQLLTLGGLGIWATIDMIIIIWGKFRDKEGYRITKWT